MLTFAAALSLCSVIDGDTIRCGGERIRLTGIDAPELGACRPRGRRCVSGDGEASTRSLQELIGRGQVRIVRLGFDRYRRTLAVVYVNGINVACEQISRGQAYFRAQWDEQGYLARDCPALAQS